MLDFKWSYTFVEVEENGIDAQELVIVAMAFGYSDMTSSCASMSANSKWTWETDFDKIDNDHDKIAKAKTKGNTRHNDSHLKFYLDACR